MSTPPFFDLISDRAIYEIPNRRSREIKEVHSGDAETAVLRFLDGRHLFIVHPTEKAAASKNGGAPLVDEERFYATLRIDAAGLVVSGDIFSDIQRYSSEFSFQSESIHVAVGTGTLSAETWAHEGFDVFVVANIVNDDGPTDAEEIPNKLIIAFKNHNGVIKACRFLRFDTRSKVVGDLTMSETSEKQLSDRKYDSLRMVRLRTRLDYSVPGPEDENQLLTDAKVLQQFKSLSCS